MTKAESFAMQYGYYDKEKKRACCVGYNAGYKQAEKDAALVPKDIEEIIHIYHIVKMTINEDDDEFYQDILDEYYRRKALEEQK